MPINKEEEELFHMILYLGPESIEGLTKFPIVTNFSELMTNAMNEKIMKNLNLSMHLFLIFTPKLSLLLSEFSCTTIDNCIFLT